MLRARCGWSVRLDTIPAEELAGRIFDAILDDNGESATTASTHFTHYPAPVTVTDVELTSYVDRERGGGGFEYVPLLK